MNNAAALLALSFAPVFAGGIAVAEAHAAPVIQGAKKGFHINEKFGFQFKPPKAWNNVALKQDETYLGAKYTSNKSYFWHDKLTGQTIENTPEVMVICFAHENLEDGVKATEDEDGNVTIRWNPYKDYDDFLKQTFSGQGFFKDSTKETKVGGVPCSQYIYKVEKMGAPKLILTWIFHGEDIDYAVQTMVFTSEYKKLKKVIDRSFKSFKLIERNGESLAGGMTGMTFITRKDMDDEDPKERRSKRMTSEDQVRKRAVDSLPDDWEAANHGNILTLSHVDKKLAKRFGEQSDALLKYFEDEFPYWGNGEYARKPMLRIFKDYEEMVAYIKGGRINTYTTSGTPTMEIPTYKPSGGFTGKEVDNVNRAILTSWLYERDPDLYNGIPQWLKGGLRYVIGGLRKDGRKLKWRENDNDRQRAKEYRGKGVDTHPRELLTFTASDFSDAGGSADRETYQRNLVMSYAFVRFLLSKECKKNKHTKDLLETYVTTLDSVIEEMSERMDELNEYEAPKTEEEEANAGQARAERFRQMERETVDATFERAFGDWGDEEWDRVHKAFWDWL
jgi:hypothetical protein